MTYSARCVVVSLLWGCAPTPSSSMRGGMLAQNDPPAKTERADLTREEHSPAPPPAAGSTAVLIQQTVELQAQVDELQAAVKAMRRR